MNAHLTSPAIAFAAAALSAVASTLLGAPLFSTASFEAALAGFASASAVLLALADYSYSRPRDAFGSKQFPSAPTNRQLQRAAAQTSRSRVAPLTARR